MKKFIISIVTVIIVVTAILIFMNIPRYELMKQMNMISAGSYSFSESYNLPYSKSNVIKAIEKFKVKYPKNKVPKVTISSNNLISLEDSMSDNGLWFVAYLYDSEQNKILNIVINGNETNSTLKFVSINNGLKIGNWKEINRDFSYEENQQLKKKFEELYFNPIKKLLVNN